MSVDFTTLVLDEKERLGAGEKNGLLKAGSGPRGQISVSDGPLWPLSRDPIPQSDPMESIRCDKKSRYVVAHLSQITLR